MNTTGNRRVEIAWERQDECIICTSHAPTKRGYFLIRRNKSGKRSLHRMICERYHGDIKGKDVMHSCDNPSCINPSHLSPGTHKRNMEGMVERNRSAKGSQNAHAKLTESNVSDIRKDLRPSRVIAAEYGVSHTVILLAKRRKKWQHVP